MNSNLLNCISKILHCCQEHKHTYSIQSDENRAIKEKSRPSKYRHVYEILFSKVTEKYDFISMNKMCIYKCVYVCMSIKHGGLSNLNLYISSERPSLSILFQVTPNILNYSLSFFLFPFSRPKNYNYFIYLLA